jgi:hypothetical protein
MIPDKADLAGQVLLQAASACSLMTTACSWAHYGTSGGRKPFGNAAFGAHQEELLIQITLHC